MRKTTKDLIIRVNDLGVDITDLKLKGEDSGLIYDTLWFYIVRHGTGVEIAGLSSTADEWRGSMFIKADWTPILLVRATMALRDFKSKMLKTGITIRWRS